jgi:hypothetical protein
MCRLHSSAAAAEVEVPLRFKPWFMMEALRRATCWFRFPGLDDPPSVLRRSLTVGEPSESKLGSGIISLPLIEPDL